MLSIYRRTSARPTHNPILKTLLFSLFHYIPSQAREIHKFTRENTDPKFHCPWKTKPNLNPQLVHSTLCNCSSDLLALSFFLWCARQPNYFHNQLAFDHMVNVIGRLTEEYRSVKGIVLKLESVGCIIRAQTFLLLSRIYWRGGMYHMVLDSFEQMACFGFEPNTFACNMLMDVLFRIGRVDVALMVLKEIKVPNFLSFNIALCNLCKSNDLLNIRAVLNTMLRQGFNPNVETFETILNCFCKVGRLREVLQVFGLMVTAGVWLSVRAWSILIHAYCKCGMVSVASDLLKKMHKTRCSPNIVTYTTLFKGYMDSHMVSNAFKVLKTMECKGYTPDLVLCNILIDCLSSIGRYHEALDTFLSLPQKNLAPDSYTFTSLLSTINLSRNFSLLPELANGLVVEVDLVVCNSLLSYFCKAGFPSLAVELYDVMVDRGLTPDKYSFAGLLAGLCEVKRIDEAINVYKGLVMTNPSLDAHFHTIFMDRLIKVGKFHEAIRVFRKALVQQYPLDVVAYTVAIYGLFRGDRAREACNLYSEMKEAGIAPNKHTYHVMLCGLRKRKDMKIVDQILQDMKDARIEMSGSDIFRICKCPHCSQAHHECTGSDFSIELSNYGFISATSAAGLSFNELEPSLSSRYKHHSMVKDYMQCHLPADTSGSEDFSDVAAAVG